MKRRAGIRFSCMGEGGSRILGNGWVEGRERSGSKFYQNSVGGRDQAIREKSGQQNTKDRVGGKKRAIGEQATMRSERCGAINWGASDWGASDW